MHKSGGDDDGVHKFGLVKRRQAAFALLALLGIITLSGTVSSAVAGTGRSNTSPLLAPKPGSSGPTATPSPKLPDLGKIPIAFEPNAGQAPSAVQYLAHIPAGSLAFSPAQL